MANSLTHALPYPIRKARYVLALPFRVSAGTPTDPTTPDTQFSIDGGATFSACAEEITTGGSNGLGYLTLSGAETDNAVLLIAAKSANCLTTPAWLHPRNLPILASGTASAGGATSITLASSITYDITGCFVRTTGGTGGGGTGGANNQARRITAYNTSTQVATVATWETNPDSTTTYDILLPEGVTIQMVKTLNPTTAGRTLDVSTGGEAGLDWANVGSPTTTLALTGTTIASTQKVDLETIKTQVVTCAAGVTVGPFVGNATAALVVDASGFVTQTAAATSVIQSGTAQGGSAQTITLSAGASSTNNLYGGCVIKIYGGTGAGQTRVCQNYNGSTKVQNVDNNWTTQPDNTSQYAILAYHAAATDGGQNVVIGSSQAFNNTGTWTGNLTGSVGSVTGDTPQTGDSFARIGAAGAGLTAITGATLSSAYDFAKGTVAVTESYNADGAAPTPVQALLVIMQMLTEMSISGTTMTVKKLDGTTTAMTLTLDSATTPTSVTRTT